MRKFVILLVLAYGLLNGAQARQWQSFHHKLPLNAFAAGVDTNGKKLSVCRAQHLNSIQIGKTWRGFKQCNIAFGGREISLSDFDVLLKETWRPTHWQKTLTQKALTLGRDQDGKRLFLCKAPFQGSMQIGKTWQGSEYCNISYAGQEILRRDFKVLTAGKRPNKTKNPAQTADYQCINHFGSQLCGYNCLSSGTQAACAAKPKQQCLADNFGHISCGYHCIKTPFKVVCAQKRKENCVINVFNEARCGQNCRITDLNRIQCG